MDFKVEEISVHENPIRELSLIDDFSLDLLNARMHR